VHAAFTSHEHRSVAEHLNECSVCCAEWKALETVVGAARRTKCVRLPDVEKDELRNKLLIGARAITNERRPNSARTRPRWVAAGFGMALVVAALVVVRAWPPALVHGARALVAPTAAPRLTAVPLYRATIREQGNARFTVVSPQPDETVRLYDGTIDVDVAPLQPGERFRVITDDGEVEVHGTAFAVSAARSRLSHVTVARGRVEVRDVSGATRTLTPGEHWTPTAAQPVTPAETAPGPPVVSSGARHQAPTAEPSQGDSSAVMTPVQLRDPATIETTPHRAPSAAEIAFQEGWAALRNGDPSGASRSFAGVPLDTPLGQDAAFWGGIALARAGRSAEAERALERFLATFPGSPHRGEALVVLGTLLHGMGEDAAAREKLQEARRSSRGSIRERAQQELLKLQ
jgi:TolA-binding protein